MANVQTRIFRDTTTSVQPTAVNSLVDSVWSDANDYLRSMNINDVCDVRSHFHQTQGKYGTSAVVHFQVTVFYLHRD